MASNKYNDTDEYSNKTHERRRRNDIQKVQSLLLIWLDSNIDEDSKDYQNTITLLQRIINDVCICMDGDDCIQFIQTITDRKACMIISGALGQHIVPQIHDMSQIDSIFIFCGNRTHHEGWAKKWGKIKGVFTEITSICRALEETAKKCEENYVSMSFVPIGKNPNQLDPSFMYTLIIKEILLTIDFEDQHIQDYVDYCREFFVGNTHELENIKLLEGIYRQKTPIWWYTCPSFLYRMLNSGIRKMDGDIITRMGFFIKDLCQHIKKLHEEQYGGQSSDKSFTVYRGQDLSHENFKKLTQTKGGLMSFDSFLSTSETRDIALEFAKDKLNNPELIGILFVMNIDPSQSTIPFASVRGISYYPKENEILFSMHSVFRVNDIKSLNGTNRLYEVNLSLTSDNDKDLCILTNYIREASFPDTEGWYRLGLVLNDMNQHGKAEEIYSMLLEQTTNKNEKASIYHQLGSIKDKQGQYQDAIEFYKKSLAIEKEKQPLNHFNIANSYNNIAVVYNNMNDYRQALDYHQKALALRQQAQPPNLPDLAMTYNNIGVVYKNLNEYSKALVSYEKALKIQQDISIPNHPQLGASCNNIGLMYEALNNYAEAYSFFERAVQIGQKSLPEDHPNLQQRRKNLERMRRMKL